MPATAAQVAENLNPNAIPWSPSNAVKVGTPVTVTKPPGPPSVREQQELIKTMFEGFKVLPYLLDSVGPENLVQQLNGTMQPGNEMFTIAVNAFQSLMKVHDMKNYLDYIRDSLSKKVVPNVYIAALKDFQNYNEEVQEMFDVFIQRIGKLNNTVNGNTVDVMMFHYLNQKVPIMTEQYLSMYGAAFTPEGSMETGCLANLMVKDIRTQGAPRCTYRVEEGKTLMVATELIARLTEGKLTHCYGRYIAVPMLVNYGVDITVHICHDNKASPPPCGIYVPKNFYLLGMTKSGVMLYVSPNMRLVIVKENGNPNSKTTFYSASSQLATPVVDMVYPSAEMVVCSCPLHTALTEVVVPIVPLQTVLYHEGKLMNAKITDVSHVMPTLKHTNDASEVVVNMRTCTACNGYTEKPMIMCECGGTCGELSCTHVCNCVKTDVDPLTTLINELLSHLTVIPDTEKQHLTENLLREWQGNSSHSLEQLCGKLMSLRGLHPLPKQATATTASYKEWLVLTGQRTSGGSGGAKGISVDTLAEGCMFEVILRQRSSDPVSVLFIKTEDSGIDFCPLGITLPEDATLYARSMVHNMLLYVRNMMMVSGKVMMIFYLVGACCDPTNYLGCGAVAMPRIACHSYCMRLMIMDDNAVMVQEQCTKFPAICMPKNTATTVQILMETAYGNQARAMTACEWRFPNYRVSGGVMMLDLQNRTHMLRYDENTITPYDLRVELVGEKRFAQMMYDYVSKMCICACGQICKYVSMTAEQPNKCTQCAEVGGGNRDVKTKYVDPKFVSHITTILREQT